MTDGRAIPKPLPKGQTLSEWRVGKVNWFVKSPFTHSIHSWLPVPSHGCPKSWATEPVVWKCWCSCVGLTFNHFCLSNDDSGKSSLKHLWLRVLTSENFQHVEGCEPNIWDELTIMQKGLSKTWSVGLCFFIHFFWQIFDEDIFHWIFGQFLTSTSGAISFFFQMLSEWLVGWAESELLWDEGHHRTTHWGINTTSILTSCRYFYFSIFIRSLLVRGLIHHSLVRLSWSSLILSTSIQPFLWG